jgi:hypothetical protein
MILLKRLSAVMLSGAILLLQGCLEDEPKPTEVLLTVNIEADYFKGLNSWLFISNEDGKTIDVRQANDSTRIRFSGIPGEQTVSLTIFTQLATTNVSDGSIWNSFNFFTYQEIGVGTTIELKRVMNNGNTSVNPPDPVGTVSFTLKNYADSDKPEDCMSFSDGLSLPYTILDYNTVDYTGTDFSANLRIRENPARILISTYHNDIPVHKWLNNLTPGDEIEVDFESFMPSNTINVNKQVAIAQVAAWNEGSLATSYRLSDSYFRQLSKSSNFNQLPKVGYVDGFDKYAVGVSLKNLFEKDNVSYSKFGTVPQAINLPEYTYSINNDNLYGLSVDFSNEYAYKSAYFVKSVLGSQVTWLLTSAKEEFKTPFIPTEIIEKNPALNVENLKLQGVSYLHPLDGYSYQNFLNSIFSSSSIRDEYESLHYQFRNQ